MAARVRRVDYFHCTVPDRPGTAHRLFSDLVDLGVNLLAFTAVPVGPDRVQMSLFPEEVARLRRVADQGNVDLDGPHRALLVQGDDEMGALMSIHRRLADARVNVYASTGVSDGRGGFGYVIYVRPEHFDDAATALNV